MDQAVVGSRPHRGRLERRRADAVDHAEPVRHRLVDIFRRDRVQVRRHRRVQPCQVRADLLPGLPAVARAHHELVGIVQRLIRLRKYLRQRPGLAVGIVGIRRGQFSPERHGDIEGLVAAPRAFAVKNVAVLRVGNHGGALARETGGLPVAEREHALARPRADTHAAAVLLRAVEPVGEAVVRGHVIDLRGRLVVPGAPRLPAVHAHDRALVAAEHHAVAVLRIDPQLVIVVSARRPFDRHERLTRVRRHVSGGVHDIGTVGISRIDRHGFEVPPTAPQPGFAVDASPCGARVVRKIDSAGCWRGFRRGAAAAAEASRHRAARIVHHRPQPPRIARRNRDPDPSHELVRGQAAAQLLPRIAAVNRFVQAATRQVRGRIHRPWRTPRRPQRSVQHPWILWVDRQVHRADVVRIARLIENLLPCRAPVHRPVDAALRIGVVHMAERRDVHTVRVGRVHHHATDLPRALQSDVLPRLSRVRGFEHADAV